MSNPKPLFPPERNQVTERNHRREVFWQITVPVVIVSILVVVGVLLTTTGSDSQVSQWADISVIIMSIPALLWGLIVLVLTAGSLYATIWVIQNAPFFFFRAQKFFLRVRTLVQKFGNRAVEPVVKAQSFNAGARRLIRRKGQVRNRGE